MGALGVTGKTSVPDEPAEGEEPAEGAPAQDEGFIPAAALVPETRDSRRRRLAKEEMESTLAPLREEWTKKETTYQQSIEAERTARQQQAEQLAQLRGAIEQMQRQPQGAQQQAPKPADPARLYEEAEEALTKKDIRGYHAKIREATRIEAEALAETKTAAMRAELQKQIPPQMPPHIQQLMFANQNVAASGERGIRAVIRMEQELEDDGEAPSYARTKKAFEAVNAKLGKPKAPARPQFSQDGAAAMSGIPTSRAANGSSASEDGVQLNAAEKAAAKAAGMSAVDYAKWRDPRKFGLIKD